MLLVVVAIVVVTAGVLMIVQLDARLAGGGAATRHAAALRLPGLRARHRAEDKASPVLFLLGSILTLLVIATLV